MGLFSKNPARSSQHTSSTIIAQGCSIRGNIELTCNIQVDGYVEGKVRTDQTLVISNQGRVKGEIIANHIVINGMYDGTCYANSIEILQDGKASGTIHCDDLSIERGGSFLGETQPTSEETVTVINSQQKEDKAVSKNEKPKKVANAAK
ncbi:bactofilin family protein [Photobacterium indicum]|uniref:bactofilin family protein n=1 Tax=Photobacterium indicum TaxID=81447 RepID=UPI003D14859C